MAHKARFFVAILCFLGCSFQVTDVLLNYFHYPTLTVVTVQIPGDLQTVDLSFCVRSIDIFDVERFQKDKKITLAFPDQTATKDAESKSRQVIGSATVADLFEYTPNVSKLYTACLVRKPNSYFYHQLMGADCQQLITVKKYFVQEFICYRVHLSKYENLTYSYRDVGFSQTYTGVIYSVTIDPAYFKQAELVRFTLGDNDHNIDPDISIAYSSVIDRDYNKSTGTALYSHFNVNYYTMNEHSLPAPFAMNCLDYNEIGFVNKEACFRACLFNHTMKEFKKVPFSIITKNPIKAKLIQFDDIANETASSILHEIDVRCNRQCKYNNCKSSSTVTNVDLDAFKIFRLQVKVPREPSFEVSFVAQLRLSEVLIYVSSCLGTWFGLSVLNLYSTLFGWIKGLGKREIIKNGREMSHLHAKEMRNLANFCRYEIRKEINNRFSRNYRI